MRDRGLLIALLVSVALNLFLIAAGASIYLFGAPAVAAKTQNPGLRRATAALPEADRKPFVTMLRADGAKVKPENRRARALREQAWSALASGSESGRCDQAATRRGPLNQPVEPHPGGERGGRLRP